MIPHSRPWLGEREEESVRAVVRSGMLIGGELTAAFRSRLGDLAASECYLFSSGRAALTSALRALQLPARSSVAVTTYACSAVAWSIAAAGLGVVPCDVGDNWLTGVSQMEAAVDAGCRAIVLAPPFGIVQSAEPFRRFGLPIIHDLCQASPAALASTPREHLGDIAIASFHPTKYVCAGGGGAALDLTGRHSASLADVEADGSAPFAETQAALGLAQLARLGEFQERRAAIFDRYSSLRPHHWPDPLATLGSAAGDLLRIPIVVDRERFAETVAAFARHGVTARLGVDNLLHRNMDQPDAKFPGAVAAYDATLSLPFHPSLSDAEVEQVAHAIDAIL
jgi:perosamine synthetase